MRRCLIPCAVVVGLLWLTSLAQSANPVPENTSLTSGTIAFTKNMGQWPDSILFRASAGGTVMWFTHDGIYYQFTKRLKKNASGEKALAAGLGPRRPEVGAKFDQTPDSIETALVKASFVGANLQAGVVGSEELAYKCNYFLGNDPSKWHTDVPNYATLTMRDIYPGVDATFRGKNGKLEYALSGPAEAIEKVVTAYSGALATSQLDGSIVLSTRLGEKRFHGLVPASSTDVQPATVSAANPTSSVTLVYSTYLGGSSEDPGYRIAVDSSGSAYVTGSTNSTNFPTQDPYQTDPGDGTMADVFVTKLSPDGTSLVYSTYLGGNNQDQGWSIAIDSSGSAYVTGQTFSSDFPTQSPYQTYQGGYDAFIAKLSASGNSLVYSTYLGGNSHDWGGGIAVDGSSCAYLTGYTGSSDFPVENPYDAGLSGWPNAFVTKLAASGNSLVYSTYLGGSDYDEGYSIAVDASGSAYVTGYTNSTDFPTQTPYQTDPGDGYEDAFVTKLSAAGNSLVYSTYLAGSDGDQGWGIAVDPQGCAYVTGLTLSTDFPTHNPYQTYQGPRGYSDAFVTKLSAAGNSLIYSTYLGGNLNDDGHAIAVDGAGNAYVTGSSGSSNFPTNAPYQTYQAAKDVFVTKLTGAGNSLVYSTYLGGSDYDDGYSIAVDGSGNTYVTGITWSTDFPTQNPYQANPGGGITDAFVTKLVMPPCCTGTRGNLNCFGLIDLPDLSLLIAYLTATPKPTLCCPAAANVNGMGLIDLSDLSLLIAYLTVTPRPALPNCP